jgi:hypothetical protein
MIIGNLGFSQENVREILQRSAGATGSGKG